ncbi:MAG: BrnT family toxin [Rhizobiales bacterium]|nr:BrnT family toxin [Hyphomicrobiales bacterium]MBI3673156.1 BrnT family toxin [Hyphomicrobiales bacterium]
MSESGTVIQFVFEAFEWDDEKATSNRKKHGIDFKDAIRIFNGPVFAWKQNRCGESRWIAIGIIASELAVVFVQRGEICRVISARRASRKERAGYHANLGR